MGNSVVCGMDVEMKQEAHRRRRRTLSRHASRRETSSTSSSVTQPEMSTQHLPRLDDVEEVLPKPLSSVHIQRSSNNTQAARAAARPSLRPHQQYSSRVRRASQLPGTALPSGATRRSSYSAASEQSNEMSFSVPDIDSRPSSTTSSDRPSSDDEAYSFGSQASAEETFYDYTDHDDDNERGADTPEPNLMAAPKKDTSANNDFTAWEMGFGIISGASRVSPLTSHRVSKAEPTQPTPLSGGASTAEAPKMKRVTPLMSSEECVSITGSQKTRQPGEVSPKPTKARADAKLTSVQVVHAMKQHHFPTAPGTHPAPNAGKPDSPYQRRVSSMVQTKCITPTASDRPHSAMNATELVRAKESAASPTKAPTPRKESPGLRPTVNEFTVAVPMEQMEPYDMRFLSPAESPQSLKPKTIVAIPLTTRQGGPSGLPTTASPERTTAATSPIKGSPTKGSVHASRNASAASRNTSSPAAAASTPADPNSLNKHDQNRTSGGAQSGVADRATDHKSDKPFPKSPGSPTPAVSSSTGGVHPDVPHNKRVGESSSIASTPSAALKDLAAANNTAKAPAATATATVATTTTLAAAAAPPPLTTFSSHKDDMQRDGARSPKLPRSRKGSAPQRQKKHRKPRRKEAKRRSLYGSDEDDAQRNHAIDTGSSADELEDSAPNLRASQKLDSILVKSTSFKSRTGSMGPQDLTTATGSVSFLLGEKEAELALASSQFMSKAVPRRKKERLRRMNEDFGMGVLNDIDGDGQDDEETCKKKAAPP